MGAVGVVTSHVVHATGGPNAHGRGEFVCRSVMSLTKRRRVCVRKRERKRETEHEREERTREKGYNRRRGQVF